jgi:putative membrane protein
MSPPASERPVRLVDMEFKPGELPAAEPEATLPDRTGGLAPGEAGMSTPARLALGSAIVVLLLIVLNAGVSFARNAVQGGSLLDLALLAALVGLVGSTGWLIAQQARTLRKLKSAERARELAVQLAKLDGAGSGERLLAALRTVYADNPPVLGALNGAASALQPHHSDRDVIELLNREVFTPMDREADERIQRAALRASLGVSSCPHPALDALVVLAISLMLIRDLMRVYGLRHSVRSLYRVLTRALFAASTTAVMSTVVEFAMKAAHDRIAAAVVGTAGEALVVARRMFALGALAKAEIRPLP